ncbi:hypothetical protein LZ30DRAFT_687055 [Colletotrichum cereale]|nr:hypothetical protein LZ30DRAFT_687055 [Colletotrichum cereale]
MPCPGLSWPVLSSPPLLSSPLTVSPTLPSSTQQQLHKSHQDTHKTSIGPRTRGQTLLRIVVILHQIDVVWEKQSVAMPIIETRRAEQEKSCLQHLANDGHNTLYGYSVGHYPLQASLRPYAVPNRCPTESWASVGSVRVRCTSGLGLGRAWAGGVVSGRLPVGPGSAIGSLTPVVLQCDGVPTCSGEPQQPESTAHADDRPTGTESKTLAPEFHAPPDTGLPNRAASGLPLSPVPLLLVAHQTQ